MARYVALLLAVLLLWTGDALGQCAWVLWTKYEEFSLKQVPPGWELQGAYPAREECLRVKERLWQALAARYRDLALKGRVKVKVEEVPHEAVIVQDLVSEVVQTISLLCLPDTVNPKR